MKNKIYRNLWAGNETYFIPMHPVHSGKNEAKKTSGYGIVKHDGKWILEKNAVYYTRDLKDPAGFQAVGEIDVNEALIQCILSQIEKPKKEKPKPIERD